MFTNILVPLDGGPESTAVALPVARGMARAMGGSVTLLRVLPWPNVTEDREATSEATDKLNRLVSTLDGDGTQVKAVVRHGDAADEILECCRAQDADLIVMRTHGRAGLERALLGSVAQRVLRRSRVPVLLVRSTSRPISHIRTLLVPVDGSPGGAVALGTALRLAQATQAELNLLEVTVPISMQVYAASEFGGLAYIDPAWDDEALAAAKSYVDGLVTRLRGSGAVADGQARMAPLVAETIAAVADETCADLVVMSTHALTGPARAVLGSVADAVVRSARCGVLLVHRVVESAHEADQPEQHLTKVPG